MFTITETMLLPENVPSCEHGVIIPHCQYLSIALNAVSSLLYGMEHWMSALLAVLRISMLCHTHSEKIQSDD